MEWLAVGWIVCGVLGYGLDFGYFQKRFPTIADKHYKTDLWSAVFLGVTGPFGLIVIVLVATLNRGLAGFKWK